MANRLKILRTLTAGREPSIGSALDFGRLAVNLTDRKLWIYSATGAPSLLSSYVGDHVPTRAYRVGDLVVQDGYLYRSTRNLVPGAFNPVDWETVSDARSVSLLRAPTQQEQATVSLAASTSLRVEAAAGQTANMQAWRVDGTDVSSIGADGYPGGAFGRSVFRVDQVAHSFTAIGQAARFDGSNWVLADAGNVAGFALGVVRRIISTNSFEIVAAGRVDGMQSAAFETGVYQANTRYYLSVANPGRLTAVPPPDPATVHPVLHTLTGGAAVLCLQFPVEVASGSGTDILVVQNPNPFTAVGQVAAHDGTAYVRADPADPAKVPVGIIKNTSGLDFLIGVSGEVPDIAPGAVAVYPLTPGAAYYSGANGVLTLTPPESSALGASPVLWATGADRGIILPGQATPNALRASQNLADIPDAGAARTNLGLATAVLSARTLTAGAGLTGGGDLSADRTLALSEASIASLGLADTAVQPTRAVATGAGLTGGGDLAADRTLALTGQALALHSFGGSGLMVRTAGGAFVGRSLAVGDGMALSNGDGVSGNPTIALDSTVVRTSRSIVAGAGLTGGGNLAADRTVALTGQALALHALAASGLVARTGAGTVAARTIVPGAGLTVANGDGVAGNPTVAANTLSQADWEGGASGVLAVVSPSLLRAAVRYAVENNAIASPRFTGNLHVNTSNATGAGIILSDDGDIVDLNDGFCSMRFSGGVRIFSGNRGGAPVITLGSNGVVTALQFNTSAVLAGQAGASAGAVGTYIFARRASVARYNSTYSGAELRPAGGVANELQDVNTAFGSDTGRALTGTWRCMGDQPYNNPGGDHPYSYTLFLRIE